MLKSKNIRPTSMRILVYEFLKSQIAARSLAEMERHFYQADKVTLYRTLKTFEEKGVVHRIQDDQVGRYLLCAHDCDENSHKDQHLHFYCKKCKQTTCEVNPAIVKDAAVSYRIDEIKITAKGICKYCLTQVEK